MKGKLFFLLAIVLLLAGCSGAQNDQSRDGQAAEVTVGQILAGAEDLVEQEVILTGTVTHVCRHGGQRLFVVSEDPDQRLKITTGDNIAEFDVSLEGSELTVTGILKEQIIDETYLAQWEDEVESGTQKVHHEEGENMHEGEHAHDEAHEGEHAHDGAHEGDQEHEGDQAASQLKKIQQLREEIAASGKDHLSEYWVEAISYQAKEI